MGSLSWATYGHAYMVYDERREEFGFGVVLGTFRILFSITFVVYGLFM